MRILHGFYGIISIHQLKQQTDSAIISKLTASQGTLAPPENITEKQITQCCLSLLPGSSTYSPYDLGPDFKLTTAVSSL